MNARVVTVLGGTGFLGRRVVRHLCERDFIGIWSEATGHFLPALSKLAATVLVRLMPLLRFAQDSCLLLGCSQGVQY
jgi:nucleoside-diphosphate-sugar epimerase